MAKTTVLTEFGKRCFDDRTMRERLPQDVYEKLRQIRDENQRWDPKVANDIANAMREWAIENGATHYIHWFTPMTGISAGKHDSFIDGIREGAPIIKFTGKTLSHGEGDASSFPSGGLRSTFEARGYTTWDPTSPAFVLGTTLYIPTAFCGHMGEALDQKTPLLRSMQILNKHALRVLRALGDTETLQATPSVGAEQEYFLVDKDLLQKRLDLKICGVTLSGAKPPKGQELDDHYYGSVSERVRNYMRDLDEELWAIGVPAKTEHNEVAPGQYELANVFASANVAMDHNQITMELMRKVALRHGFACLLHEKPYSGINGSGKHNNWSLDTPLAGSLLKPGDNPVENRPFLLVLCAVIAAVDDYADLIRLSAACPGNDLRLGGNEAPPAIISIFLGQTLTNLLQSLADGHAYEMGERNNLKLGVRTLPLPVQDDNDRNRTSPFAFTGNKFEFRMLGSSQSIGLANTVISAAVADKLAGFADLLEAVDSDKIDITIAKIIHDVWDKHSRIIFNGNNYSDEWVEEAKKRGLPNLSTMVEATESFISEKNIAMFERTKVFSPSECHSRYEILLESYVKQMRIAADTLLEMTRRSFLPAACSALGDIATTVNSVQSAGGSCRFAGDMVERLSAAIDNCANAETALQESLCAIPKETAASAKQMQSIVQNEMTALRAACDALEVLIPEDKWPVPGYSALLYDL